MRALWQYRFRELLCMRSYSACYTGTLHSVTHKAAVDHAPNGTETALLVQLVLLTLYLQQRQLYRTITAITAITAISTAISTALPAI